MHQARLILKAFSRGPSACGGQLDDMFPAASSFGTSLLGGRSLTHAADGGELDVQVAGKEMAQDLGSGQT